MARIRVSVKPILNSWEDVDHAMHQILLAQSSIEEVNAQLNRSISEAKKAAEVASKPAREKIAELELQIREFVVRNRNTIKGKSKKLNFGQTGFRLSTKLVVPTSKATDIIAACKKFKMQDCVTVKESINKEALKRYPLEKILQVGASLKSTDEFWYEVATEEIAPTESAQGCEQHGSNTTN